MNKKKKHGDENNAVWGSWPLGTTGDADVDRTAKQDKPELERTDLYFEPKDLLASMRSSTEQSSLRYEPPNANENKTDNAPKLEEDLDTESIKEEEQKSTAAQQAVRDSWAWTKEIARKHPRLSDAELREKIAAAKLGDKEATQLIVLSSYPTIVKVLTKYRGYAAEFSDIAQDASMLIQSKAIRKYNLRSRKSFYSYACYYIRQAIFNHIRRIRNTSGTSGGATAYCVDSLDATQDDDSGTDLLDQLASEGPKTDALAETNERRVQMQTLIMSSNLSQIDKEILFLRYGLINGTSWTYQQIADRLGRPLSSIYEREKRLRRRLERNRELSSMFDDLEG